MRILQLSLNLLPNVGGLETHLSDLFNVLIKKKWTVFSLAYRPLSTKTIWKFYEKKYGLTIIRIPWVRGLFERLVTYPVIEFFYLFPGLFIFTPFALLLFKPTIVHAHGLIPAASAIFWGKLFGKRVIISLHNYYNFPIRGLYRNFVALLLKQSDFVLSLSKRSNTEVISLGIDKSKTAIFTYWVDLQKFKKIQNAKKKLNWQNRFIVLFVGRLVEEKGIELLLESVKSWNRNIYLVIIGTGPLNNKVLLAARNQKKITFLGKIDQEDLAIYYSAADLVIFPSLNEEGFGRVIIESLACSTPVIASNKGAIPEVIDKTVGKLININPEKVKEMVEYFFQNPSKLNRLAKNARKFAQKRYSEVNINKIIEVYKNNKI